MCPESEHTQKLDAKKSIILNLNKNLKKIKKKQKSTFSEYDIGRILHFFELSSFLINLFLLLRLTIFFEI